MLRFCVICGQTLKGRPHQKTCGAKCRVANNRKRGKPLAYVRITPGNSAREGNCVPNAISTATGFPFAMVEEWLLAKNPTTKSGYRRSIWEPVVESIGFTLVPKASGKLLDSLILDPQLWYLAQVLGHMVAIHNGQIFDAAKIIKRRRRVLSLWVRK